MAVQAKRGAKDSVLIEKTKVILDTLTPTLTWVTSSNLPLRRQ